MLPSRLVVALQPMSTCHQVHRNAGHQHLHHHSSLGFVDLRRFPARSSPNPTTPILRSFSSGPQTHRLLPRIGVSHRFKL